MAVQKAERQEAEVFLVFSLDVELPVGVIRRAIR